MISPSSWGKNCNLAWNVFFPVSRLQMSEKICVAYAQKRHGNNFYILRQHRFRVAYALLFKCSSSTVLAVLGLDRGDETRKPFSSVHSVPGGIWEWTLSTRLALGYWLLIWKSAKQCPKKNPRELKFWPSTQNIGLGSSDRIFKGSKYCLLW